MRIADVIPETFFDLDATAMKERMQKIMDERVIDPETSIVRYSQADLDCRLFRSLCITSIRSRRRSRKRIFRLDYIRFQ